VTKTLPTWTRISSNGRTPLQLLLEWKRSKKLSDTQVARHLGMSQAHLRAREAGEMTLWACTQLRIKLVLLHGVPCQRFHKSAVIHFTPAEIKSIRESAGLSHHNLAKILGVKTKTAVGYENVRNPEKPKPVFYYVLERLKEDPTFRP